MSKVMLADVTHKSVKLLKNGFNVTVLGPIVTFKNVANEHLWCSAIKYFFQQYIYIHNNLIIKKNYEYYNFNLPK